MEKGSYVFYPGHGLGQVASMDDKFLKITIKANRLTVMIPVAKIPEYNLRPLSDKVTVIEALDLLNAQVPESTKTWNKKQREYNEVLSEGNLKKIALVVAEIKSREQQSFGEKKILENCLALIKEEAEAVLGSKISL